MDTLTKTFKRGALSWNVVATPIGGSMYNVSINGVSIGSNLYGIKAAKLIFQDIRIFKVPGIPA